MAELRNKKTFYALWHAGWLGNRPRTWTTAIELATSGYRGKVTIRSTSGAAGRTLYGVDASEAPGLVCREAWGDATFNEAMPDDLLRIQGEATRLPGGLYLRYDTTPGLRMVEAMRRAGDATGLRAVLLLRRHLDAASLESLDELLDRYPGAVVEFGCYDVAVDVLRRNTVIWEVRNY